MPDQKTIKIRCFRYHPGVDSKPRYETYQVPMEGEMSLINALEYIYEQYDRGLGFYSCCRRGNCLGCPVKVDGKNVMACTFAVTNDIQVDPINEKKVIRDLLVDR